MMTDIQPPDTVVLIHGFWLTPISWQPWVDYYEKAGMKVLAPGYPIPDDTVDGIRSDPSQVATLDLKTLVDHYENIIRGLDKPPILMGHSAGGAIVQLLLDRGCGASGVAISSAPVKGVLRLPLRTLKTLAPVLRNLSNRKKPFGWTPEQFHDRFTNNLTAEDSLDVYNRFHVPSSGKILFQSAAANFSPNSPAKVNKKNDERPPLLFIGSEVDHFFPPAVNKSNVKLYRKSKATTDYKEFAGRSHYTCGEVGWEEVADYAMDWAQKHA